MTEGTAKMAVLRSLLPDAHFKCNGDLTTVDDSWGF
jgi:hypothetical protein